MMNSNPEHERIRKYLTLDVESLYSLIPPYLQDSTVFHPEGQRAAGRRAFESIKSSLRQKVCIDARLQDTLDDAALQDKVNLVIVVADLISSLTTGVPPFLIASIIVRIGLREFCSAEKADEE